jgi:hypothetical protein
VAGQPLPQSPSAVAAHVGPERGSPATSTGAFPIGAGTVNA